MERAQALPGEGLVRDLALRGLRDPVLLRAFLRVPRARFLPPEQAAQAECDRPLEIGYGQTCSQPFVVAKMLAALELKGSERVLEIGTGSGYQTALLCEVLARGVFLLHTVEILPELSARAASTLRELGYPHVALRVGDGALGWPEAAPYDAIIVSAAPAQVPPALLEQLAPGGRLVIPVGAVAGSQELELWRRDPVTLSLERRALMAVRFVPLIGIAALH